jgi:hypothetical protein
LDEQASLATQWSCLRLATTRAFTTPTSRMQRFCGL